ncbi:hypothetical protein Plut_1547 [Pelodictyon luteolum DSM 273]|uniref:Uncharacterized protein n=1 Tax=Chlorobium luteolum (strain DSM 273 / BCRC 81028 / 2530) TaxID=319225 RepID=Q3B2M7_CHLL3|nr:hypothetical protein Plut_1547 [Pelodictyon luteolum DSM 273]
MPSPQVVRIACTICGGACPIPPLLHGAPLSLFKHSIIYRHHEGSHILIADEGETAEGFLRFGNGLVVEADPTLSTTTALRTDFVMRCSWIAAGWLIRNQALGLIGHEGGINDMIHPRE